MVDLILKDKGLTMNAYFNMTLMHRPSNSHVAA